MCLSLAMAANVHAQEPDWTAMPYTSHAAYQAVDANGGGVFATTAPVKMRGVILNRPGDMLNTAAGADAFMGGYWQEYIQAVDSDDFGGTALWMGQNIGKMQGNHPAGSYTDAEWQAEVDRLSHDPATGREFRPGDLVEVRARAPGLFNRGKTNINEQHTKNPAADFDVVLIQADYGVPNPQLVQLAELKDASDQFTFDETRATGNEHYQAAAVRINGVSFTSTTTWAPGGQLTIQDGTGRTFPVLLGRGEGFTRYDPPTGTFDIVGILDQEDKTAGDGYKGGYRLWVMDYAGNGQFRIVSDWNLMGYTPHREYEAVDADGAGTFSTTAAVKMRGVLINWPQTMLDGRAAAPGFLGGQWQAFFQAADTDDFGGTAMFMGQYVGRITGNHPAGSYTDAEWLAEVDRLNHDPVTGRLFRPGDLVEIRARAPGLFHNGKTNINEQHQNDPAADFEVVLLQAGNGSPAAQTIALSDVKDASDQFIFDPTRLTGAEHLQGTLVKIPGVSIVSGTWAPGQQLTITDGMGHTLPLLLGLGSGFTLFGPPTGVFDVVGVFDQEDGVDTDGFRAGYRLWAMDYDGSQFVVYRYVKPDLDRDGDVDGADLARFGVCFSGPAIPQTNPDCLIADFDGDKDVDQSDFGLLQRCTSGVDKPADPLCDQ